MNPAQTIDSNTEMNFFNKLKKDKHLKSTKIKWILLKFGLKHYYNTWKMITIRCLEFVNIIEYIKTKKIITTKIKIIYLLKLIARWNNNKKQNEIRAFNYYKYNAYKKALFSWEIFKNQKTTKEYFIDFTLE